MYEKTSSGENKHCNITLYAFFGKILSLHVQPDTIYISLLTNDVVCTYTPLHLDELYTHVQNNEGMTVFCI